MPFPLSFKNIAILGLLQVGVVVAGVLGAGVLHKCSKEFGLQLSQPTKLASDYGVVAVVLPIIWITVAMAVQSRNEEDHPEALTFVSGVVVLEPIRQLDLTQLQPCWHDGAIRQGG